MGSSVKQIYFCCRDSGVNFENKRSVAFESLRELGEYGVLYPGIVSQERLIVDERLKLFFYFEFGLPEAHALNSVSV